LSLVAVPAVGIRVDHANEHSVDHSSGEEIGHDVAVVVERADAVTRREAEVLGLVGARMANADIAARLQLSVRTVENHVSSLLRKYGVADRRALVEVAAQVQRGAVEPGRVVGVPMTLTTFIGRDTERETLLDALSKGRLVTLQGPGGVGKTRLAAVIAELAAASFPSGGAFVDLVPVRDGYVAQAVAAALDVTERSQQSLEDAIAERLGDGRSLLILDNCEHVIDAAAAFVERLLSLCPGTRIMATSRERLGIAGERIVLLAPLPLGTDAEALFADRAGAADPGFVSDPATVAEICARLDGMPLAIELAAARSMALGTSGVLAALDDTLRLLGGGRGVDERHRSLRAVIGWSYDLLDDEERRLFRRLAPFAGAFDLQAAAAVAGDGDRGKVADLLGRLVDKSLVAHQRGVQSSWRLLETMRAFAAEQLQREDESDEAQHRHLLWAAECAAGLEGRIGGQWRDEFDRVADDLRAALTSCPAGPDVTSHGLAKALGHLTFARRFLNESVRHYERAASHALDPALAAQDLRDAAGCAHFLHFSGQRAFDLLIAAAAQAAAADDGNLEAIVLARAVEIAARYPGGYPTDIAPERLRRLLEKAASVGDSTDPTVAAGLAAAAAWSAAPVKLMPEPGPAAAAEMAARATGDPVLINASLDAVRTAATTLGRLREAHRISTERFRLLPLMDRDNPGAAAEIEDTFNMATTDAIAAGDLPAALSITRLVQQDDLVGNHPYLSTSKVIPALVLTGSLHEALWQAAKMWEAWQRAGKPAAGWTSPAMSAVALAHGFLGDDSSYRLWQARAVEVAGVEAADRYRHLTFAAFVDARVATHSGNLTQAKAIVDKAFGDLPTGWYESYARAAAAELAVVAGLPEAEQRLAEATPAADENLWAAACLARADGRLRDDADALARSIQGWESIGARLERACTLILLPDRAAEGHAELEAMR
jgi:predicted ATPase/DNA-binding CsgD family transcriptional regulator